MPELFERAKPDDADLLSELQSTDRAILVAMNAGTRATLPSLVRNVLHWLQVSPSFMSLKAQTIQSNSTTISPPVPQKCHDPPQETISLWRNLYFSSNPWAALGSGDGSLSSFADGGELLSGSRLPRTMFAIGGTGGVSGA